MGMWDELWEARPAAMIGLSSPFFETSASPFRIVLSQKSLLSKAQRLFLGTDALMKKQLS